MGADGSRVAHSIAPRRAIAPPAHFLRIPLRFIAVGQHDETLLAGGWELGQCHLKGMGDIRLPSRHRRVNLGDASGS